MSITLNQLDLTPDDAEADRSVVEKMAYFNWLDAGCPEGRCLDFWLAAEREWIEYCFVPRQGFLTTEEDTSAAGDGDPAATVGAKAPMACVAV